MTNSCNKVISILPKLAECIQYNQQLRQTVLRERLDQIDEIDLGVINTIIEYLYNPYTEIFYNTWGSIEKHEEVPATIELYSTEKQLINRVYPIDHDWILEYIYFLPTCYVFNKDLYDVDEDTYPYEQICSCTGRLSNMLAYDTLRVTLNYMNRPFLLEIKRQDPLPLIGYVKYLVEQIIDHYFANATPPN